MAAPFAYYLLFKKMPKGAKVAPVRFLNYTPSTTIISKKIAYIPNLTVML